MGAHSDETPEAVTAGPQEGTSPPGVPESPPSPPAPTPADAQTAAAQPAQPGAAGQPSQPGAGQPTQPAVLPVAGPPPGFADPQPVPPAQPVQPAHPAPPGDPVQPSQPVGGPLLVPESRPRIKYRNAFGWIAVVLGIVGLALACLSETVIVGWLLLLVSFIFGIIGLSLAVRSKGVSTVQAVLARATTIAAIIISIVGIAIGVNTFLGSMKDSFHTALDRKTHTPLLPGGIVDNGTGTTDEGAAPQGADSPGTSTQNPPGVSTKPLGTRENPIPFGQAAVDKEWKVTLGSPREAGGEVAAENQYNDPPDEGMEYWIVPVTAAYNGESTGNPGFDVVVSFLGKDNKTYDSPCGTIPDPIDALPDVEAGDVVKGNTCVVVPKGAEGLWEVAPGFNAKPVFFTKP